MAISSSLNALVPNNVISNPRSEVLLTQVVGDGVAVEGAPEGIVEGNKDGAVEMEGFKVGESVGATVAEDGAGLSPSVGAMDAFEIEGAAVCNIGGVDGEPVATEGAVVVGG